MFNDVAIKKRNGWGQGPEQGAMKWGLWLENKLHVASVRPKKESRHTPMITPALQIIIIIIIISRRMAWHWHITGCRSTWQLSNYLTTALLILLLYAYRSAQMLEPFDRIASQWTDVLIWKTITFFELTAKRISPFCEKMLEKSI